MAANAAPENVTGIGHLVGGLAITCLAGVFNGSWNASFSPKLGLAVGKTESNHDTDEAQRTQDLVRRKSSFLIAKARHLFDTDRGDKENGEDNRHHDLSYNHAFMLFQIYAVLLNVPICILWVGGANRTSYIVSQAPSSSIGLVILFSILWGIGSLLFGLACRLAGVGLGTNLTMGVVVVLGTLLPMLMEGVHRTVAGGIIFAGLVVCCVALYFSMASLKTRGEDKAATDATKSTNTEAQAKDTFCEGNKETENKKDSKQNFFGDLNPQSFPKDAKEKENNGKISTIQNDEESSMAKKTKEVGELNPNDDWDPQSTPDQSPKPAENIPEKGEISSVAKIGICILAGVLATQLQFAFVFGQPLVDIAEKDESPENGSTPEGGSASIIWLFAISLGSIPSIIYGLYNNPDQIPLKTIWFTPWWRHVLVILTTSVPWVSHIHLYGWANSLLPADVAASVAWPVLMMVTVGQGMILSVCLGEWKGASRKARRQLGLGLALAFVGICLIMVSLAV